MASGNLSTLQNVIANAFSKKMERLSNHVAPTAAMIPTEAGFGSGVFWTAQMDGAEAHLYQEGAAVLDSELSNNVEVPANLPWGHYRTAFKVTETQLDAAASSRGSADEIVRIFGTRMDDAVKAMASRINVACLLDSGTGTAPNGQTAPAATGLLGGALAATGTYAGISRASFPLWAGNVLANGGQPRPITSALFAQGDVLIRKATNLKATGILMDFDTWNKYRASFESKERIVVNSGQPMYNTGSDDLYWNGIRVMADKDMPSGTIIMGDWSKSRKVFLPNTPSSDQPGAGNVITEITGTNYNQTVNNVGLPAKVEYLAKDGDSIKVMMFTRFNVRIDVPKAFVVISDIAV
jgi:hypothetical protein